MTDLSIIATMRKFVSIAGLICIVLMLAGCSVRISNMDKEPIVTSSFKDKTGEVASLTITLPDNNLPVLFGIGFEKTTGTLEVTIDDTTGKEVFKDTVQANDTYMHKKEVPEPLKYNWGFYRFNKVMDKAGTYTIHITGNGASGTVQLSPMTNNDTYFTNFTGTAVKVTAEGNTDKEMGFNLQALPTQDNKGVIMAKIYDPDGVEIRSTRLTYDPNNESASQLIFWEKPAKNGTYTAIIEAKDASGSAIGNAFDEKEIPWLAFVKPILFVLLGIALYLMIRSKDRRVMVWGGMFWMIATFIISILFGLILKDALAGIMGPNAGLIGAFLNTIALAIVYIVIVWFSKYVVEIKKCSPTELVAFAFGFAFVSPILTGLSDLMSISKLNGSMIPAYSSVMVPGVYASSGLAGLDISTSVISLICQSIGTIAALIIFLWVFRQRDELPKSTLWMAAIGSIFIKIVVDCALLYSRQAMSLILMDKPAVAMRMTFGFSSPTIELLTSTGILVVIAVLVIVNWKKIMGLALKACPVTIDDLTNKEAK